MTILEAWTKLKASLDEATICRLDAEGWGQDGRPAHRIDGEVFGIEEMDAAVRDHVA